MSILHINQIERKIRKQYALLLDLTDLGEINQTKDEQVLSRCLAAYAIDNANECTTIEAAQSVVDGGNDNGIDALFYSSLSKKMTIVQSKWSKTGTGEPDSASVAKFCTGIKDLFNAKLERFNQKVDAKKNSILKALMEFDTKYEIILIDTHIESELSIHSRRQIDDLVSEMNNTGDESSEQIVSFKRMNQGKVLNSLAYSAGDEPIHLELGLSQWGMVNEPYKAFFGILSGAEVASWWERYKTRLFNKNIRQVLGVTDVNDEIEITIDKNPELFWYYNNGITIICDSIEKSSLGGSSRELSSFKLSNVAIVNGAQTVSSIGKYLDNDSHNNLEHVKLYARIISLKDAPEHFDKEVTKSNNRQNRIENRDFVSQDIEQLRIKTELSINDIEYSIMRSETFKNSKTSFDLNEATVALACAKNKTSLTVQAKRGIGKFYENLERGIYKEIFNNSVEGIYVYNCVLVNRVVDDIILRKIKNLDRRSGKSFGLLVHGNRIISQLTFHELNLSEKLNEIDFKPDSSLIETKVDEVIDKISKQLETLFPDNILGTLFKNTTKCTTIVEDIIKVDK